MWSDILEIFQKIHWRGIIFLKWIFCHKNDESIISFHNYHSFPQDTTFLWWHHLGIYKIYVHLPIKRGSWKNFCQNLGSLLWIIFHLEASLAEMAEESWFKGLQRMLEDNVQNAKKQDHQRSRRVPSHSYATVIITTCAIRYHFFLQVWRVFLNLSLLRKGSYFLDVRLSK